MFVYLDNSATTQVSQHVIDKMLPFFTYRYGNPSSPHAFGQNARDALLQARSQVSLVFESCPHEIIFTSSGSESDNYAIKGVTLGKLQEKKHPPHIITSAIEHHAIHRSCEQMVNYFGCQVSYVPVDCHGLINPDDIRRAIRPETILISIMYANNEVGTIQPVHTIASIAREFGILFHTDAIQAPAWLPLMPTLRHADLISFSGHKIYGPKGIGGLYVREGVSLTPLISGGTQEFGMRGSTESVPLIVGMGVALEYVSANRINRLAKVRSLRDKLIRGIFEQIDRVSLTGHHSCRLPNHASFVFEDVDARLLIDELSERGVMVSSGAACTSGNRSPSHVLKAMGISDAQAMGSIRITLGDETCEDEIAYVLEILPQLVSTIRSLTPSLR